MKGAFRWLVVFLASIAAAKLIESFLTSASGRRLLEKTGSSALVSEEGLDIVGRYTKEAVVLVLDTILSRRSHQASEIHKGKNWANFAENASYVISAIGSLLRVAADFWRERQELRERQALR